MQYDTTHGGRFGIHDKALSDFGPAQYRLALAKLRESKKLGRDFPYTEEQLNTAFKKFIEDKGKTLGLPPVKEIKDLEATAEAFLKKENDKPEDERYYNRPDLPISLREAEQESFAELQTIGVLKPDPAKPSNAEIAGYFLAQQKKSADAKTAIGYGHLAAHYNADVSTAALHNNISKVEKTGAPGQQKLLGAVNAASAGDKEKADAHLQKVQGQSDDHVLKAQVAAVRGAKVELPTDMKLTMVKDNSASIAESAVTPSVMGIPVQQAPVPKKKSPLMTPTLMPTAAFFAAVNGRSDD